MSGSDRRTFGWRGIRFAARGIAMATFVILPWGAGCDTSSVGDQLTAGLAADPASAVESEALAKANLNDVTNSLDQLAQPGALGPGDPGPPLPPCVDDFRQLTRLCLAQTRDMATACVQQIADLFDKGEVEAAHMAAAACIDQINLHTEGCLTELRDKCRACIGELMHNDAPPGLIRAVLGACQRAAERILHARRGAVGAVRDAVDVGDARHCIQAMHQVAAECADQNAQIAEQCVAEIEALLAKGDIAGAIARAEECIQQIRQHTGDCVGAIHAICQDCLGGLIRNCGNGGLVGRVLEACKAQVELALGSARQAVRQIRDSLPPPEDGAP